MDDLVVYDDLYFVPRSTPTYRSGETIYLRGEEVRTFGFVSFCEKRLEVKALGPRLLELKAPPVTSHAAIGHLWVHRGEEEVRGPLVVILPALARV